MKAYIVKQKDIKSRIMSRSGGIFAALSDEVLSDSGVIYGATLDADFMACHARANDKDGRDAMRGSKYIQSCMGEAMKLAREDLLTGRTVLWSGTPCQVAGFRSYCGNVNTENLLCVDIVCHGVPSPRVWADYLHYMEEKHHGKVQAVDFRNKKDHGWWEHIESVKIHGIENDSQVFERLFYGHRTLRECCYECSYKNLNRVGDITIADAWGIAKANPEFDDNKGVSLVLCNTDKGEEWLTRALYQCDYKEVDLSCYMQDPLRENITKPEDYEAFWEAYNAMPFSKFIKNGYEDTIKQRIKWRLQRMYHKVLPEALRRKIGGGH